MLALWLHTIIVCMLASVRCCSNALGSFGALSGGTGAYASVLTCSLCCTRVHTAHQLFCCSGLSSCLVFKQLPTDIIQADLSVNKRVASKCWNLHNELAEPGFISICLISWNLFCVAYRLRRQTGPSHGKNTLPPDINVHASHVRQMEKSLFI